jgi:uncharacterized protein
MTQAEALYHLQEIDLRLLSAHKRLKEIETALGDNRTVVEAQTQLEVTKRILSPMQAKARNLELETQSTREKANAAEEHLYSGRVRNPKEMQDIQKEIEALKRRYAELDDTLLELMMSIEEVEATLSGEQTTLEHVTAAWENAHQGLLTEQSQLQSQMKTLQAQRTQALTQVTAENLQIYNNLRTKKNHQPMALMSSGSCTVCGVEQTMAIEREARSGQKLVNCLSCGRILVYKS